jgi:hypothetical protein
LTAIGLASFLIWLNKAGIRKIFKFSIVILIFSFLFFNFTYFQHGYWQHYSTEFSGEWQYGYKPAIEFIKTVEDQYEQIWFTEKLGRPYIYLLFYLQKNPYEFWQEAGVEREVYGFVKVKEFGKYFFGKPPLGQEIRKKSLFIDTPSDVPGGVNILKEFFLLNGSKILVAYED